MHISCYLMPRHNKTGPMGTKYRACRIIQIPLWIIVCSRNNFFCIVARLVTAQDSRQSSAAFCIGCHLRRIISHLQNRGTACNHCHIIWNFRRFKAAVHFLNIRNCPSRIFLRHFKPECINRLKKHTFCTFKSVAYRPVSCLPEIAALSVL